jgi:ClpP class serine protease
MDPISLFWLFIVLASLQPAFARQALLMMRRRALADISRKRKATAITLIHRQESMSLLGFPLMRFIDIDDAEGVLRAIHETPPGQPIEIIVHTPGGLVIAAQQIASALADHEGRVTVVVPHYAMSGGTLIAIAANEMVLDGHAALGPVDPQLGQYPAASVVEAVKHPGDHDDQTLIMADVARKALVQVEGFAGRLLERHMPPVRAREVAHMLASGMWTHDHPLQVAELRALGLPVTVGVPAEERELMKLYPQPRGRTPAVEYVPGPAEPTLPARRELPRGRRAPAAAPAHVASTRQRAEPGRVDRPGAA